MIPTHIMKHCHRMKSFLVVVLFVTLLVHTGCRSTPSGEGEAPTVSTSDSAYSDFNPRRLISSYKNMQEGDIVSWRWIQPGFQLSQCETITAYSVENFSGVEHPWAEKKAQNALNAIAAGVGTRQKGPIHAGVQLAITEMLPNLTLYKKLFSTAEEKPYIQIELVVLDEQNQTPLIMISHFKKDEDFNTAVENMLDDLKRFFEVNGYILNDNAPPDA